MIIDYKHDSNKITKLKDILSSKDCLAGLVDNRLRELDYILTKDCSIKPVDILSLAGTRIYEATLKYVILYALKRISPTSNYLIRNGVSKGILLFNVDSNKTIDEEFLNKLSNEVSNLISNDLPISRLKISLEEAKSIFNEEDYKDKVELLEYRNRETVNVYKCNDYYNYLFGYMLPSTGYLNKFKLSLYNPGILITYPRSDSKGEIPELEHSITYDKELFDSSYESTLLNFDSVRKINEFIDNKGSVDLINISENLFNRQLVYLADDIENKLRKIKLIAVAGPSSSGKTTFTNRLRAELVSRAIKVQVINIDNYYFPPEKAPLDEDGLPNLESIHALDIERFGTELSDLLEGKVVKLKKYNFKTHDYDFIDEIQIDKSTLIMIEGIHALNDELTSKISRFNKYKIFIAPTLSVNLDDHNPINVTDIRLIRRIVRDKMFRNTTTEKTFSMWPSVRKGEFLSIYPFSDNADFVFNSGLYSELAVLKEYAIEALNTISEDSEYYIEANRLLKFLRYITAINVTNVPCNSILREFVGGSSFEEGEK